MSEFVELYIDQGTDFSTQISINDDATNNPQTLTGYTVTSQLRRSLISANTSETFDCLVADGSNGEIIIAMAAANTANLKFGKYFFDVRLKSPNNDYSRVIEGVVYVQPAITK